ncbi:MAG: hypothetical protein PF961_04310 [Planctomycetota bacterium]|jgi:type II secretory pathway pseudopilin PulG|nr:hypothetical protein [Planctomycetota bacterium]
MTSSSRSGFLLIVVAGILALLAVMCLTFVTQSRSDAEEASDLDRRVQARLMLGAGLAYIQESSRLGWDLRDDDSATAANEATTPSWSSRYPSLSDPNNLIHEEAFGWVDVRNGQIGPLTRDYDGDGAYDPRFSTTLIEDSNADGIADRPAWPAVGSVCRAPLHRLRRPPFAIQPLATPNPIVQDPSAADFGLPLLRRPDPQPLLDSTVASTAQARWHDHRTGDPEPDMASFNRSWFRIHRDGPATFVVTCGAGMTLGFADWDEVRGAGMEASFGGQRNMFEDALAQEVRLHFRCEWSPAVSGAASGQHKSYPRDNESWPTHPNSFGNKSKSNTDADDRALDPGVKSANQGGTIQWIQRLETPPAVW